MEVNGYAADWWPFLSMFLLLVAIGALLWAVTLVWTAWVLHRPPRMTAGRALARLGRATPPDVGLEVFEEERFELANKGRTDGSTLRVSVAHGVAQVAEGPAPAAHGLAPQAELAAWWVPHPGADAVRRTCVMLHGYGDSRAGALAWAPMWQRLGFHLLLLDLRAHGDSGGRVSGGGVWERDDLHRVLDELRRRRPIQCRQIVLFGVSYGGMIAAACAAGRDDIAALVLDSPVEGWASATRRYAELLGLPLAHAHGLRLRLAQRRLNVRFDEGRPAVTLPEVRCPILAILPRTDVLVSPQESEEMARLVEAKGPPSRAWCADAMHNLALATDSEEYERRIREFLAEALRS